MGALPCFSRHRRVETSAGPRRTGPLADFSSRFRRIAGGLLSNLLVQIDRRWLLVLKSFYLAAVRPATRSCSRPAIRRAGPHCHAITAAGGIGRIEIRLAVATCYPSSRRQLCRRSPGAARRPACPVSDREPAWVVRRQPEQCNEETRTCTTDHGRDDLLWPRHQLMAA